MEIDEKKIDETVLAPLYLTLDREGRAWKGFDFAVIDCLHEKGFIANPVNNDKSVQLTEEGITEAFSNYLQSANLCPAGRRSTEPW
jgi:hypothetical protein